MIIPTQDHISLWPFRADPRGYVRQHLRPDLLAALTVGIFAIPQAMAYAILGGLPPVNGLYAAMVMAVVAAIWGSSPFVNTGPTNSAALLTLGALSMVAPTFSPEYLALAFWFTIMVGLIRIAMGLMRAGRVIHFVSQSVFLGFTMGAGLLIACGQLHELLGVPKSDEAWFMARLVAVLRRAPQANLAALGIGLGTLLLMVLGERWARKVPVALLVIASATLAAKLLPASVGLRLVQDIASVPTGLPMPVWYAPDIDALIRLLPGAVAVALIGLVEAVSIGQSLALKHQQRLNFNQEFFGQGLSHLVGAFFQGLPGSGSFSRSALMEHCGAHTRMGNVFFGGVLALALLLLAPLFNLIPIAALAGLLLYIGYRLVDFTRIRQAMATTRKDVILILTTFATTVFVRVEYGIFAGLILSLLFFLYHLGQLEAEEYLPLGPRGYAKLAYSPSSEHAPSPLVLVAIKSELFFALAQQLRDQLDEIARRQNAKHLIISLDQQVIRLDAPCWLALLEFAREFHRQGGQLYVTGIMPGFGKVVKRTGFDDVLPSDCIFEDCGDHTVGIERAVNRVLSRLDPTVVLPETWEERWRRIRQQLAAGSTQPGSSGPMLAPINLALPPSTP